MLLGQTNNEGRVLAVINNGGGKIFERLPRLESMSPRAKECLLNPQTADFSGMAQLWDMRHVRISRADDFDEFEGGGNTVLLEIVPDEEQTKQFWAAWDKRRG
jgi:2-succinyl-5-enolpyruvyl-6-hydroxy-3-cyclohexene-1-carboxylate synthase